MRLDQMFSARWLGSEESPDWQLVNHVVVNALLVSSAEQYCDELVDRSAEGLGTMRGEEQVKQARKHLSLIPCSL